jgi:hypothetical protein
MGCMPRLSVISNTSSNDLKANLGVEFLNCVIPIMPERDGDVNKLQ